MYSALIILITAASVFFIISGINRQTIAFCKATHKKMIQNLVYTTAYNAAAIPPGAGALFRADIIINPALGAVFMSLSNVAVAIHAQLLKKVYSNP